MKIKFTMGLPASGKSTWAKEYCSKNKDWIRVNRDDLRNMRGDYWIPKQEDLITQWENDAIIAALSFGHNVILDATNLNSNRNKHRYKKLKELFPELQMDTVNFMNVGLSTCIKRDLIRPNSVGKDVITGMYDKYIRKKTNIIKNPSLPGCVIFDVDGTLAKMSGRNPFDWHRVKEDLPKDEIIQLAKMYKHSYGYKIIVFTGRDGCCLNSTKEWLRDNGVPFDDIYIRPEGNQEKDSIIKERLFMDHINGVYNCHLVVDDRDQVVDMWRKTLGITCLQVDYGNF